MVFKMEGAVPRFVKISIIVPVYNAGEGLKRCLDCLLSQTMRDVEIILVCDCPTDGSDEVAREYAARDNRVVLIENERNLNVSLSRNAGLAVAKGEYVGFSDHDDYCSSEMYGKLYEAAKAADADVAASDMYEEDGTSCRRYAFPAVKDGKVDPAAFAATLVAGSSTPVWNQIFRRSFIAGTSFKDGVSFEDGLFNIEVSLKKPVTVYVQEAFYHHVIHGKNAFGSYAYRDFAHTARYLSAVMEALDVAGCRESYKHELAEGTFRRLYSCILNEYRKKGIPAALKLCRTVKSDSGFAGILALYKDNPELGRKYGLAKRIVLGYLCG